MDKEPTTEWTRASNLFVGNLNFSKLAAELKIGISDIFAKNDLAVVDVGIGLESLAMWILNLLTTWKKPLATKLN